MNLSEREWTVLNALWKTNGAELGVLVNELYKETGWNRNTVHTYLTRMEAKGLVRINKEVTPHIYCAMIDRESCQQKERHSFLNRVYSGSAGDLIAAFLKEEPISQEEREKLRKILQSCKSTICTLTFTSFHIYQISTQHHHIWIVRIYNIR